MTRIALAAVLAVAAGGVLWLLGEPGAADAAWAAGAALVLGPLVWSVARTLRRGDVGVDAIALVAIAGALLLGEYLAGAVVALMLAGGNALEAGASSRARRELRALVERAPRRARRRRDGLLEEISAEEVVPQDVLVVGTGELVPVDGRVLSAEAVLDESTLTGEPLPRAAHAGEEVRSGSANAGAPFELRALRPAAESTYAALVRLVREAEGSRAPLERVADRYAAFFLPVTLLVAGLAWALSGDPVRALAVLVVATPCPLILAAPIALISGVSRAARLGIVVKGAAPIERLGRARTVLLDKTGTVTVGSAALERVAALDGLDEDSVLRLAASLDQVSPHPLAAALVRAASARGLRLSLPEDVSEDPGHGIAGRVDGLEVAVGSPAWLSRRGVPIVAVDGGTGRVTVAVSVDGRFAGAPVFTDPMRADAATLVASLRAEGVAHVALVTGDGQAVAETIGRSLAVDRVYAEATPADKLELVRRAAARPELRPVVMVGDGVNDAPALAAADVGIAMSSAGATVAAESADVVIVVDRVDRVVDALRIGRRSLHIARQSVLFGIGLSLVAMVFAALGHIPPVAGALLQEAIDVAVILNALRALRA